MKYFDDPVDKKNRDRKYIGFNERRLAAELIIQNQDSRSFTIHCYDLEQSA